MSVVLRVFDRAPEGAGASSDLERARFDADLAWLTSRGARVERGDPTEDPVVREALARGAASLPIVVAGERIATDGGYPSRETLAALAGVALRSLTRMNSTASGCCEPDPSGSSGTGCC
jgi:hypothetical protein